MASAIVKRFERRIAGPGVCGEALSHCFGHLIEQRKKTIKYTMAIDGPWLSMNKDNQQSTDSRWKWLGDIEEEARWVGSVGLDIVPSIWPAS
jgi:hypothetical protein